MTETIKINPINTPGRSTRTPVPIRKMRAMLFEEHGGPEKLKYGYCERPEPGPNEVLVKVRACALNHLDLWNLQGMPGIKIKMPHILGSDISGEIVQTGKSVKGLAPGRSVILAPGLSCGKCGYCKSGWDSLCASYHILGFQVNGGYAEYVSVPQENVLPVSSRYSYEEWAAVPLVFLTAWHMLVTRAQLKKGEKALIHSAGSGVGSAAVQIAKYLGAEVFATVGSEDKVKRAKAIGADEVILTSKKDFSLEVMKLTHNRGADVVFEHIGPDTFHKSLTSLAKKGRLVTCGATSGPVADLDLRFLFIRQISVTGCYMGGLWELKKVLRLLEKKKLRPVVDKVFPLREARTALERMRSRSHFGKIILIP